VGSRSQVTPRTVWTVAFHVLLVVGVLWLVDQLWPVLSWVLLAAFLALAAWPVVQWLERHKVRRGVAVLLVGLGVLALGTLLVVTVVPMLVEQVQALVQAVPGFIDRLQHQRWVERLDERYDLLAQLSAELRQRLPGIAVPVLGLVTGLLWRLVGTVTVVVLAVFFLLFGGELFNKALLWVRPAEREHWRELGVRMHRSVGGYVAGVFIIASIGGVVTGVTMALLGVPYFLPLALLMALLGLIPFVGAWLGGILVVGTTFASAGVRPGLIALAVYFLYQQAENHLLQPLIQRHTLKMNPLLIALVMLGSTGLAGIVGALLALPVAGAVQVFLQDRLARRQAQWGEPPARPSPPAAQEPRRPAVEPRPPSRPAREPPVTPSG
jgi:putative heme transporter